MINNIVDDFLIFHTFNVKTGGLKHQNIEQKTFNKFFRGVAAIIISFVP
jgi:hypothetical protein